MYIEKLKMHIEFAKRCSKCGEVKSVDEFSKNKATIDGLLYQCKQCAKVYNDLYAQSELYKEKRKKYHQKYQKTDAYKESLKKYRESEKFKLSNAKYRKTDAYKTALKKHKESEKFKLSNAKYQARYYQKRKLKAQSTGDQMTNLKINKDGLPPVVKRSEFKNYSETFWVNEKGVHGCRYQCKFCGLVRLGLTDKDKMHKVWCPVVADV